MSWLDRLDALRRTLEAEVFALSLAIGDARTPWYAKVVAVFVLAYALSPIDLIPDPIPVLGYLDDLIIIPLGVLLLRRLIPQAVLVECRQLAQGRLNDRTSRLRWLGGGTVVVVWLLALGLLLYLAGRWLPTVWHHGS